LARNLVVAPDRRSLTVVPSALRDVFYADCPDADVVLAELSLGPESVAALAGRVHVTTARWGAIPRVYVECTEDRAISIATQRAMVARAPCERVLSLETSHSPFFSAPEQLARHLAAL
jgi:pimeloyl-ACP methyl ester carboxylesterase